MKTTQQKWSRDTVSITNAPFWKKILWMLLIYGGSVLALFAVASAFRLLMAAAGMKTH